MCGRFLGICVGFNGIFFVVDVYKGLFEVNFWKCEVKLLLFFEIFIEGKNMFFVNDFIVI